MQFSNTFTRGDQSQRKNLQYDQAAFYYFISTVFFIGTLILGYIIAKNLLRPQSGQQYLLKGKNHKLFKQQAIKTRKPIINCFFIIKILFFSLLLFCFFKSYFNALQSKDMLKGFDPYAILQVQPNDSIEQIKKSYRKLALKYHPDKNKNDPKSRAYFILILKAYESLTDQEKKQNFMKYGNPDGARSSNIGIALPSILVEKRFQLPVMIISFIILLVIVPSIIIYWNNQIGKKDDNGLLMQNHPFLYKELNENITYSKLIDTLSFLIQFQKFRISKQQIPHLDLLKKQIDQSGDLSIKSKKECPPYAKKVYTLICAHLLRLNIHPILKKDYEHLLQIFPKLIYAVCIFASKFSGRYFAQQNIKCLGASCLCTIIQIQQMIIQKCWVRDWQLTSLCLSNDQIEILRKKKKHSYSLKTLVQKQVQQKKFLELLNNSQEVKQKLDLIGIFSIEAKAQVLGEEEITDTDVVQIRFKLKRTKGNNLILTSYPFLIEQSYYIIMSFKKNVIYFQHIKINEGQLEHEFTYISPRQFTPNKYTFDINVKSAGYRGLDINNQVNFEVISIKNAKRQLFSHPQEKKINQKGFFDSIFSNMNENEDQELSQNEQEIKKE